MHAISPMVQDALPMFIHCPADFCQAEFNYPEDLAAHVFIKERQELQRCQEPQELDEAPAAQHQRHAERIRKALKVRSPRSEHKRPSSKRSKSRRRWYTLSPQDTQAEDIFLPYEQEFLHPECHTSTNISIPPSSTKCEERVKLTAVNTNPLWEFALPPPVYARRSQTLLDRVSRDESEEDSDSTVTQASVNRRFPPPPISYMGLPDIKLPPPSIGCDYTQAPEAKTGSLPPPFGHRNIRAPEANMGRRMTYSTRYAPCHRDYHRQGTEDLMVDAV